MWLMKFGRYLNLFYARDTIILLDYPEARLITTAVMG
jgi:hypothetical protein